jgi:allantoinase
MLFEKKGVITVQKILEELQFMTCKIHFTALSSVHAIQQIKQLKRHKMNARDRVSCEIAAHQLFFQSHDIREGNTKFKCLATIRDQAERELLQIAYKRGNYDCVTSFHFPVHPKYKFEVDRNFFKAMNGMSALGFTLQAMWTMYKQKQQVFAFDQKTDKEAEDVFMRNFVTTQCSRPAEILGIDSFKGSIQVGKQADFIVFDPEAILVITPQDVKSKFPELNPYIGVELKGRVEQTYLKGQRVWDYKRGMRSFKDRRIGTVIEQIKYNYYAQQKLNQVTD